MEPKIQENIKTRQGIVARIMQALALLWETPLIEQEKAKREAEEIAKQQRDLSSLEKLVSIPDKMNSAKKGGRAGIKKVNVQPIGPTAIQPTEIKKTADREIGE